MRQDNNRGRCVPSRRVARHRALRLHLLQRRSGPDHVQPEDRAGRRFQMMTHHPTDPHAKEWPPRAAEYDGLKTPGELARGLLGVLTATADSTHEPHVERPAELAVNLPFRLRRA